MIVILVIAFCMFTHVLHADNRLTTTQCLSVTNKARIKELATCNLCASNVRISHIDLVDTATLSLVPACINCGSGQDSFVISHIDILDPSNLTNIPCPCTGSFDGSLDVTNLEVLNGGGFGCNISVGCDISMVDSIDTGHGNIIKNDMPFMHNYPSDQQSNTFLGYFSGTFSSTGQRNTGIGFAALPIITTGNDNTSLGNSATEVTTGNQNSACGYGTLVRLNTGNDNSGVGFSNYAPESLNIANTGSFNTLFGSAALGNNTTGSYNTALGRLALFSNQNGSNNCAIGDGTLTSAVDGNNNIAIGFSVQIVGIIDTVINNNIFIGFSSNDAITNASNNIIVGSSSTITSGNSNILISYNSTNQTPSNVLGIGYTNTSAYIAGIANVAVAGGVPVIVEATGNLGTIISSQRFKTAITDIDDISHKLYQLRPVQFTYRDSHTPQYGFIAEEVAAIYPELVVHDSDDQLLTIRHHLLLPLLINAYQKRARTLEDHTQALKEMKQTLHSIEHRITHLTQ